MSRANSRENRTATTFWMDKELKELAQSRANDIGMTLTDLINRSVRLYIREGHKLDAEVGQKMAMAELAQDIKESGKFELKLAETSQLQKGLQARISDIEHKLEQTVSEENVESMIRAQIAARIEPLVNQISIMLTTLKPVLDD